MNLSRSKKSSIFILIAAILVMILYHLFAYIGHYGYDDMDYAHIAVDFLRGHPDFSNHFTFRFALVLPLAVSYFIFGVSDFASALPAMLATSGILLIVYFILRKRSLIELSLGLVFTLLSHWFIFYSDKLMPDIFVALAVALAVFSLHQFRNVSKGRHPLGYALLLTAALLFGFMAKGTILLILPWLLYVFKVDLFSRKNLQFWLFTALSGMVFLGGYFLVIYFLSGSFSSRFDALAGNAYLNSCSYDRQSVAILLERLSTEFFKMGIQSGLLAAYIFVFAGFFTRSFKGIFRIKNEGSYFLMAALILFLSANFMTISPVAYVPMCVDVRHFLFLIPIAAIPAAKVISGFLRKREHRFGILIFVILAAVLSWFIDADIFQKLYLPLAILFSVFVFFKLKRRFLPILVILIIYILANKPYDMVTYAQNIGYETQKQFVLDELFDDSEPSYILTNPVEKRLGEYYGQFRDSRHVFLDFKNFDPDTLDDRKRFLLRNWYTEYLAGLNSTNLPAYIQNVDSSKLLAANPALKLSMFDANALRNPHTSGVLIFETKNNFESSSMKYWHQDVSNRVSDPVYKGSHAERVGEYSATLRVPLDSISVPRDGNLYFECQVFTRFEEPTEAQLVATITDSTGVILRKSIRANPFQMAFSNWWPVKLDFEIESNQLEPTAVLTVYLWNVEKTSAYADDFSVKVWGLSED